MYRSPNSERRRLYESKDLTRNYEGLKGSIEEKQRELQVEQLNTPTKIK